MTELAAIIGRFLGAVLAECAPVLVQILREARRDTAEDSMVPDDLVLRLRERLRRHQDDLRLGRDAGADTPAGEGSGVDV